MTWRQELWELLMCLALEWLRMCRDVAGWFFAIARHPFAPFNSSLEEHAYLRGMAAAGSYKEWYQHAMLMCNLYGYYDWRKNTKDGLFDYAEVLHRTHGIRLLMAKCEADPCEETYTHLMIHLRSDLVRGPAGILKPDAFTYSIGTKKIIEEYVLEIQNALELVAGFSEWHPMKRYTYLNEGLQAHGNTALLLSGGNSLSLYHLGVSKVLCEMGFFPRVVCGTGAGAVIAAILCSRSDDELQEHVTADVPLVDFSKFTDRQKQGGLLSRVTRRLKRWRRQGTLMDINVIYDFLNENLGDITFKEAYEKTGRVLNIVISNLRECKIVLPHTHYTIAQPLLGTGETKWVANYLTAPDVLVATAAAAAISQGLLGPLLWKGFTLKRKNPLTKAIELYTPSVYASEGTAEATAINRLSEQFGVTCVIRARVQFSLTSGWVWDGLQRCHAGTKHVRKAAPGFAERLGAEVWREMKYRSLQILRNIRLLPGLGTLSSSILSLELLEKDCEVDVEIATHEGIPFQMLAIPSANLMKDWQDKGEHAVWPMLTNIQMHLAVEQTLEDLLFPLKAEIERTEPAALFTPDFPFPKIVNLHKFCPPTMSDTIPFPSPVVPTYSECGHSSYMSNDADSESDGLEVRRTATLDYGFAGSMIMRQMNRRRIVGSPTGLLKCYHPVVAERRASCAGSD